MAKIKRNSASSKDASTNWNRNILIILAVVLAVGMVGSYMMILFNPSGYHDNKEKVSAGDMITIGYTIFDDYGYPVMTTFEDIAQEAEAQNYAVWVTPPIEIPAGTLINETDILSLPSYPEIPGFDKFAFLGFEFNSISSQVVGMELGSGANIPFDYEGIVLVHNVSKDSFNDMFKDAGINFSILQEGSRFPIGIATSPTIVVEGGEAPTNDFRIATVTKLGDDFALLKYGYPGAQVYVLDIQK